MSRVLIAWELGANLGHLTRLITIAKELRNRGEEILFVLRDLRFASQLLTAEGFRFIPAPHPPITKSSLKIPLSYSDILALQGMANIREVQPQIDAWLAIFEMYQPHLLLLDNAPVAMFAARLKKIPRILIGTGFEIPPFNEIFLPFRSASKEQIERLRVTEKEIVRTLNRLNKHYKQPEMVDLSELFKETHRFLLTIPELDHFQDRTDIEYAGIIEDSKRSLPDIVKWPVSGGKRIFVYLQPNYVALDKLLQSFFNAPHSMIFCIPNLEYKDSLPENIRLESQPINTKVLISEADLVISHGGHGIVSEAFLTGKPQFLFPEHIEQALLANKIAKLKTGIFLSPTFSEEQLKASLDRLLEDGTYRLEAKRNSNKYRDKRTHETLQRIADRCQFLARMDSEIVKPILIN